MPPYEAVRNLLATCYELLAAGDFGRVEVIAGGRYRDTFACAYGEWRFAARPFLLDQTGDLSMHMVGR